MANVTEDEPSPQANYFRIVNEAELGAIRETSMIVPTQNDWGIEPRTVSFYFEDDLPFNYVKSFIDDTIQSVENSCGLIYFRHKQTAFSKDESATPGFRSRVHQGPLNLKEVINLKIFEIRSIQLLDSETSHAPGKEGMQHKD